MDTLESVDIRVKKTTDAKDTCIDTILGIDDHELSKPKDELVKEFETEDEKYLKNVRDIKNSSEELVSRAEELLRKMVLEMPKQIS